MSKALGESFSQSASGTASPSKYTNVPPSTTTSKRNRRSMLGSDEFMAAAIGDTAWLRQSLKAGKNPANFDKNGLSAIHLAALHGRMECLKLLVEKYHVSVNLASSTGWRPIHLCINSRTGKRALECMNYLLDRGADPSAPNEDLMTPTHQAAIEGSVKCMELLLGHGAEISKPDSNGHLPLDYAKIWGHRKCARILASETWKREKESELSMVSELQQLKSLKDVVDDLERQDEQAYRDIQVDQSYHDWLDNKGLKEQISPRLVSNTRESISLGTMANQLYQANSPRKVKAPAIKVQAGSDQNGKGATKEGKGKAQKIKPRGASIQKIDGVTTDGAKQEVATERLCKGKRKPKLEPIPKVKVPVIAITGKPNVDKATLYTQTVPDLPQEVIEKILLEHLSPHERPLSFKCKNIIDAQHKRLYDSEEKPMEELYAHISNDRQSKLFPGGTDGGASSTTKSSRSSDKDSSDTRRIADTLKHIAKPYRFPQIHGEDYTYAFEVL